MNSNTRLVILFFLVNVFWEFYKRSQDKKQHQELLAAISSNNNKSTANLTGVNSAVDSLILKIQNIEVPLTLPEA